MTTDDAPMTLGPYLLQRELGRGGQGVVYLAQDRRLGRRVAVKVLQHLGPVPGEILARFQREAAVASKLDHPGICTVYDAGIEGGVPFIAMRFVEGESLASRIRSAARTTAHEPSTRDLGAATEVLPAGRAPRAAAEPPTTGESTPGLGIEESIRLVEGVARALHAVHEAGVVHRDIKPANVMVTPAGEPVVMDFGLARDSTSDDAALTRTGDVFGTPLYMSPEQLSGAASRLDRRTDVWSLGVVLYECLALRRPFEGLTREALCHAITSKDPPAISRLNPEAGRDLAIVVATALEKDLDRRYRTALDLAEELRRVRERKPILARPASARLKLLRFVQRNPAVSALAALVFVALAGGLAATWVQKAKADARLEDWERLADGRRLEDLVREADGALWPALPSLAPGMERWLGRARELTSRRAGHLQALAELRARGRADGNGGFAFEDASDSLRHDRLAELVKGLEALEAAADPARVTLAGMELRLEAARSLARRTLDEPAPAWAAAAARVRANRAYAKLELSPQLGLVPLGPDPDSGLEEFSETATGVLLARGADGRLEPDGDCAVVFVLVPGGTVTEGSQNSDPSDDNYVRVLDGNEAPVQDVKLDPFLLSKYELTQGQWLRTMGANPSYWRHETFGEITLRNPVDQVSWDQAQPMLRRIGCRLPTEAQWEYACRAGTTTPWSTGNQASSLAGHANIADEGSKGRFQPGWIFEPGFEDGHPFTAGVGLLRPNAFGLHDMHGNVWELCEDAFALYKDNPPRAGDGLRTAGGPERRVFRGGSFRTPAHQVRSAMRGRFAPGYRDSDLGLRVARALAQENRGI